LSKARITASVPRRSLDDQRAGRVEYRGVSPATSVSAAAVCIVLLLTPGSTALAADSYIVRVQPSSGDPSAMFTWTSARSGSPSPGCSAQVTFTWDTTHSFGDWQIDWVTGCRAAIQAAPPADD